MCELTKRQKENERINEIAMLLLHLRIINSADNNFIALKWSVRQQTCSIHGAHVPTLRCKWCQHDLSHWTIKIIVEHLDKNLRNMMEKWALCDIAGCLGRRSSRSIGRKKRHVQHPSAEHRRKFLLAFPKTRIHLQSTALRERRCIQQAGNAPLARVSKQCPTQCG